MNLQVPLFVQIADGQVDWDDPYLWQPLSEFDLGETAYEIQQYFFWLREPFKRHHDATKVHNLFVGYRNLLEILQAPTQACWSCKGEQEVTNSFSGTGFAGGRIYMDTLACGHVNADESADVRAAM